MDDSDLEKLSQSGVDIKQYQQLLEKGDSTIISRIGLLVEQERLLRIQQEKIEAQLRFILKKKNEHYEQLQKNSESNF